MQSNLVMVIKSCGATSSKETLLQVMYLAGDSVLKDVIRACPDFKPALSPEACVSVAWGLMQEGEVKKAAAILKSLIGQLGNSRWTEFMGGIEHEVGLYLGGSRRWPMMFRFAGVSALVLLCVKGSGGSAYPGKNMLRLLRKLSWWQYGRDNPGNQANAAKAWGTFIQKLRGLATTQEGRVDLMEAELGGWDA